MCSPPNFIWAARQPFDPYIRRARRGQTWALYLKEVIELTKMVVSEICSHLHKPFLLLNKKHNKLTVL